VHFSIVRGHQNESIGEAIGRHIDDWDVVVSPEFMTSTKSGGEETQTFDVLENFGVRYITVTNSPRGTLS